RADRVRQPRQPGGLRSRGALAGPPRRTGQPQPQHAGRGRRPAREGPPHGVPRHPGRDRRGTLTMNGHTLERMNIRRHGVLVLADGSVFEGELFGAPTTTSGEVVFNTALSGYTHILTH